MEEGLRNIVEGLENLALWNSSIALAVIDAAQADYEFSKMKLGAEMRETSAVTRELCEFERALNDGL